MALITKIEEITNLIEESEDLDLLLEKIIDYHPYDIAMSFNNLDSKDKDKVYKIFSNEDLAKIFSYLYVEDAAQIIEDISDNKAALIINEMESDDAADLFEEIEDEKAEAIYNLLDQEAKESINFLSAYDEDTAGAIMNSNFIVIKAGKDIKDLMKLIVKEAPDVETINTSFIVDNNNKLLGTLDLKKVIITKSPCKVEDIMNTNFQSVNVNEKIETVIKIIGDYDIYDMPVIDDGILKGIITMDDALENLIEETEDDYAKLAGLTDSQRRDESTFESVKKRLPWLMILLILGIFIAVIISSFDYLFEIESLTVLIIFQPIILGLAGNSGTQSLAITVRKISKDQLELRNSISNHLSKEILLGILSGFILGILACALSSLLLYLRNDTDNPVMQIGFIVGVSIFISLTSANLFGSLIPVFFYKIKIDPAIASGPFITTLIDVISIVIYFSLATILIYSQLV